MVDTVARRGKDEFSERVKTMRESGVRQTSGSLPTLSGQNGSNSPDFSAVW